MNILIIGGMHGNEPLGLQIGRLFLSNPIQGIDVILANEQAIVQDCRFVQNDLNRCFPGNLMSDDYETRRAAELLELTKQYDVVLDFHNTHCPDNDCGFVGTSAPQKIYDVSAWLGLNNVIVADYDCINKYAPNCLSVEVSLDSSAMSSAWWYDKIVQMSQLNAVPQTNQVTKYEFVYRMTLDDARVLNLAEQNLRAFEPIDPVLAVALNVKSPAYPIFIADKYTPYNYGGLLNTLVS